MRAPLSYVPALPGAMGLITGIVLYDTGIFYWGITIALVLLIVTYILRRQYFSYYALFTACGIFVSAAHEPTPPPDHIFIGKHNVYCRIERVIERTQSTAYIASVVKIDTTEVTPFKARLSTSSVENILHEGSTAEFKVTFHTLSSATDLPNETDYRKYLLPEGITCTGSIISSSKLIAPPDTYHQIIRRIRDGMYNSLVDAPYSAETASFMVAALYGDKSLLGDDDFQHFRSTGVAHILALSGLHAGIIASLISLLLFPLSIGFRRRYIRGIIVAAIIWVYTILTGMQPSLIRAAVMLTVVILSGYLQRGYHVYNSLLIAVIVILLINPAWLYTPGFQLSVSAVASLLMFGNVAPMKLKRYPLLYYSLNLTLMPIAAMLGTGIVSAYYFGTFPTMFVLGNMVVGILSPWLLGGGAILAIFTAIGINFRLMGCAVDTLYHGMDTALTAIRDIGGEITGLYFSAWVLIPYAAAMIFLAFAIRQHKQYQWLMCISMLLLCVTVNSCDTEDIPQAELYIPRRADCSTIIMRSGSEGLIYTDADSPDLEIAECSAKYRRFLLSRGCDGFFKKADKQWSHGYITIDADYIDIGGNSIRIIGSNVLPNGRHTRYTLITNGYTGSIKALKTIIDTDTLLLGANLHASRRARMIRECGDSIAFRDLRKQGFCITIP